MKWSFLFFINGCVLGLGLSMDSFSRSVANALHETDMKKGRMCLLAGIFAFFQFIMPLLGWICIHTIIEHFTNFQKFIPYIAFVVLSFIGIKMIIETIQNRKKKEAESEDEADTKKQKLSIIVLQGISTSIDALSVGFTISTYTLPFALAASFIIFLVTFIICLTGLKVGKVAGKKLSDKAEIFGGIILILLGIEILINGIFF